MNKELLQQVEVALVALASYQSSGYLPTIHEYGHACRTLDAVRAAIAQPVPPAEQTSYCNWADFYIWQSGKKEHTSDCATSSAPAYMPGPCDCTLPQSAEKCYPITPKRCLNDS